jgi:cob(I)alamin adenosyltransferase
MKNLAKKSRKGLNIFYYGKGKGKTTAAMGVAARAAGAGMNVFILQFVKAKPPKSGKKREGGEWPISSEILFFDAAKKVASEKKKIGKIESEQVGLGFVGILGDRKDRAVHIKEAKHGLARAKKLIASDKYDLIVLDELVSALELKLISEKEILDLIKKKPLHLHLIYTGHDNFKRIIAVSDLVSEINMIKHPYYKGILAQRGIDF